MEKRATSKGKVPKITEEEYTAYINSLKNADGEEAEEEAELDDFEKETGR